MNDQTPTEPGTGAMLVQAQEDLRETRQRLAVFREQAIKEREHLRASLEREKLKSEDLSRGKREAQRTIDDLRQDVSTITKERNAAQKVMGNIGDLFVTVGGYTPDQVDGEGLYRVSAELVEQAALLYRLRDWMGENVQINFEEHGSVVDAAIHVMETVGRGLPKLFEIMLDGPPEKALDRLRDNGILHGLIEAIETMDGPTPAPAQDPDPRHGLIDRDIQDAADGMNPTSIGQRVAIENTLQAKRDKGIPATNAEAGLIQHTYVSGKFGCQVPTGKETYCGYSPEYHAEGGRVDEESSA